VSPSTFGIFDAFPDDAGRQAQLSGKVAAAPMEKATELRSVREFERLARAAQAARLKGQDLAEPTRSPGRQGRRNVSRRGTFSPRSCCQSARDRLQS
jgi:hypothetical protein